MNTKQEKPNREEEWKERFWLLEKKYNLSLDNENYDDLMLFAKEIEAQALAEQREEILDMIKVSAEKSTNEYLAEVDEYHCRFLRGQEQGKIEILRIIASITKENV